MKKTVVVVGASRGIGAEIVKHLTNKGIEVIGVSRSPAANCQWLEADISSTEGIEAMLRQIGEQPIDALIFAAGVWERYGFTEKFDFRKTSIEETQRIMAINLVAPIEISKGLASNLTKSDNPRAIYLGALSGLDNIGSNQVAYASSKFGLRGAMQSLRLALQQEGIGFTAINLGNVATDEVLMDMQAGRLQQQNLIPIKDINTAIDWILSSSVCVEVGDINLMVKG